MRRPERISGLARRARHAGYHRERMFVQTGKAGSFLIVYLELDEDTDPLEFQKRLMSYQDEWTAWWDPQYTSFFHDELAPAPNCSSPGTTTSSPRSVTDRPADRSFRTWEIS